MNDNDILGAHIVHDGIERKADMKKAANISLKPVDILNKFKRKAITNNNNFMCTMNGKHTESVRKYEQQAERFETPTKIQRKLRQIKNPSEKKYTESWVFLKQQKTDDEKKPISIHISVFKGCYETKATSQTIERNRDRRKGN